MTTTRIALPTLHPDQVAAFNVIDPKTGKRARFKAIRCGRRWGKTDFGKTIACDGAIKRQNIGWFAPDYKISSEAFNEIADILEPVKSASSKVEGVIRTSTKGRIDFWTLDNERAGRSRKYHKVIIDEGAFTKPNMMDIWEKSILPTLLDFNGSAYVLSNTNGVDPENFFWRICNQPEHGFVEYHAPTFANPHVPARRPDETEEEHAARRLKVREELQAANHPMVFAQEYMADFVDWSGVAFFPLDKLLVEGEAVPEPVRCDSVYGILDTATKTGSGNDGTALTIFARTRHGGHPLVVLDWDIVQIEGSLLEAWLPSVFARLEDWAKRCGARMGSLGVWIEDRNSGEILLQQTRRRNMPAAPIESRLTALGKDERALSVSGYVHTGMVKFGREAYDKTSTFKNATRNHQVAQVVGFRIGDKDAAKRADDLLDTFVYGIALALGDGDGF